MSKSEKIAVHCPTEGELERVEKKAKEEGYIYSFKPHDTWATYEEDFCLAFWVEDKILTSHKKGTNRDFTLLSATDYLAYGLEGKESKVVIGSKWKNKVSGKVHTIIGVDGRGWYRSDVGGLSPAKDYPAHYNFIEEGRAFEVGDRVEVVGNRGTDKHQFEIGVIGKITQDFDQRNGVRVRVEIETDSWLVRREDLKLIKKGKDMKEHTVPLRVDDRVRVVGKYRKGEEGKIENSSKENSIHVQLEGVDLVRYFTSADLELIPTEKDITVGSVWEALDGYSKGREKGQLITVSEIVKSSESVYTLGDTESWGYKTFLHRNKLIHRGDEVVEKSKHNTGMAIDWVVYDEAPRPFKHFTIENKQTNKKGEKKMKQKTRVITIGLDIMDEDCSNLGKVVYFDVDGKVAYKEADGEVTVGRIEDIILAPVKVILPKPKPVKGKGKRKGRGK